MNLLSRLALVTLLVCAGFGALYWVVLELGRGEIEHVMQDLGQERAARLDIATQLQGAGLESLVSSYAWWDDMVRFMDKPDEKWAGDNIDNIVGIPNGGDAVWVLDANLQLVHTIDKDYRRLPVPFASPAALRRAMGERYTFRYYALVDGALWEIFGAAIQDANFWRHQTPVRGYLLLGRRWDESWITQLNTLVGARVTLHPGNVELPRPAPLHEFRRTLRGPEGEALMQLELRFNFDLLENSRQTFIRYVVYVCAGAFAAIALIVAVFAFLVLRPLGQITRSLESRVPAHLSELLNSRTEFGDIARLIAGQLRWGRMLEEEMRRQLERANPALAQRDAEANEALRLRLASNIHDGPIQSIYAAGLQLAAVQTAAEQGLAPRPEQIAGINAMLQQASSDLRNLILDLEPEELRERDLETALARIERHLEQFAHCHFELRIADGALDGLSRDAQTQLYFICRELASNALRHARPKAASLHFSTARGYLLLEWQNDGVGARSPGAGSGSGLRNIERRLAELGGSLHYGPLPDHRWRVEAEVPYSSLTAGGTVAGLV
jgi:signal transduction histidine kinase